MYNISNYYKCNHYNFKGKNNSIHSFIKYSCLSDVIYYLKNPYIIIKYAQIVYPKNNFGSNLHWYNTNTTILKNKIIAKYIIKNYEKLNGYDFLKFILYIPSNMYINIFKLLKKNFKYIKQYNKLSNNDIELLKFIVYDKPTIPKKAYFDEHTFVYLQNDIYVLLAKLNKFDKIKILYENDKSKKGVKNKSNLLQAHIYNNFDAIKYLLRHGCRPCYEFYRNLIYNDDFYIIKYILNNYPKYRKILSKLISTLCVSYIIYKIVKNDSIYLFKNFEIFDCFVYSRITCESIISFDKTNYLGIIIKYHYPNKKYIFDCRYNSVFYSDDFEFDIIKYIFKHLSKKIEFKNIDYDNINKQAINNIFKKDVTEILLYNCFLPGKFMEYALQNGLLKQIELFHKYKYSLDNSCNIILSIPFKKYNKDILETLEYCMSFDKFIDINKIIYNLKKYLSKFEIDIIPNKDVLY